MAAPQSVQELNQQVADQLLAEVKNDPQSIYAGKLIGIANGQVVVVADNWDDVATRLEQVEPDLRKTFCIDAGADYGQVQEIWGLT